MSDITFNGGLVCRDGQEYFLATESLGHPVDIGYEFNIKYF